MDLKNKIWSYTLPKEKLDQDNNYFIRSRARNKLGSVQKIPSEWGFVFDKTPPNKVSQLSLQEISNPLDLKLSWREIDDNFSGIDHYEVYKNGEIISVTDKFYQIAGMNRTNYFFKVRACDKAGNCGPFSNHKEHRIQIQSLVINEIQISGDREFIELYNPTNDDISLNNWYLAYCSPNKDWGDTPHRLKKFPEGEIVQSEGYYLIGVYNFSEFQSDWQVKTNEGKPYNSGQMFDTAGSVVIYSSNPQGKDKEFLQKEYIDAVAWGAVSYTHLTLPTN